VEPVLCNDREISKCTKAVSRQRLSKDVPAATDTNETIEVLLETVFSALSVQRGYKTDNLGNRVIDEREALKKRGRRKEAVVGCCYSERT
jgi:hypothetical protein